MQCNDYKTIRKNKLEQTIGEKDPEGINRKAERRRTIIRIGTWNLRSLTGKEDEVVEEMKVQDIDYLGVTEIKRKGKGMKELREGYWLYWSGVDMDKRGAEGVGLIVKPGKINSITNERYVNERLFVAEVKMENNKTWTMIVAYAPNDNANKEEKEAFFQDLQIEIDGGNSDIIMMGDTNGRVGNNNDGIERHLGPFGEIVRNDNGNRLIDLCVENDFVIANSKFMHKDIHKYTREVKTRNEKSIIDYFVINRDNWRMVRDVKVQTQAEIGSDHFLLIMQLVTDSPVNAETKRTKIIKQKIKSYKLRVDNVKQRYQKYLERELDGNQSELEDIETKWTNFKRTILNAATSACGVTRNTNKTNKKTKWWTSDIQQKVKEKKVKWKKYLQTGSEDDYKIYKLARTEVKLIIKKEKGKLWEEFGLRMKNNYSENQKLFYSTLKQLRAKKQVQLKNIKDKEGNIITEDNKIMQR